MAAPGVGEHDQVGRFRAVIARRLGLALAEGGTEPAAELLRARAGGDGPSYLARLDGPDGAAELKALVSRITVGETYFFRNVEQLEALAAQVARGPRPLRILSAGCSTGEEAYTLAMVLRERLPDLAPSQLAILGVDLNAKSIEHARRGRYSPWALRATPEALAAKYFRGAGRDFAIADPLRDSVRFEERNLLDEDPLLWRPGGLDAIFCRNVIMYLTPDAARAVIARLRGALAPGGLLFLGFAETLRGISLGFHLRHSHDTFYYQRADEEGAAPSPPSSPSARVPEPAGDGSWVEVIRRASQRVERLTANPGGGRGASPAAARLPSATDQVLELIARERFAEARAFMESLPKEALADADTQLLLGVVLTNAGELGEAERLCALLLARDELNAGAHYLMALAREHQGDPTGAAEHDAAAAYLDASFAMPRLHLGLLAKRRGDFAAARDELARALALLEREDPSRILLFGGGFTRQTLAALCQSELAACGGG